MKGGTRNDAVNFRYGQFVHLSRRSGALKERPADGQCCLVARANRNDACQELFKDTDMPMLKQFEQCGLWKGCDSLTNEGECAVDIERLFLRGNAPTDALTRMRVTKSTLATRNAGSPRWIRTNNLPVNSSRTLYR